MSFDLDGFLVDEKVEDEREPLEPDPVPRLPPLRSYTGELLPRPRSNSEPALKLNTVPGEHEVNPEVQEEAVEAAEPEEEARIAEGDPPTATALEIIQAVEPEAQVLELDKALTALDSYVKGRNSEQHAGAKLQGAFEAAFRVGWWTVLLSLPISIWPVAMKLQEIGTIQRVFLDFWGSMLLQFLFCVGPTLGVSIRYTLEGWLGTALATVNMLLLNNVGGWMAGGAYRDRLEFNDTNETNVTVVTSRWLPLCNTDADLSYHGCVLNLNMELMDQADYAKAIFTLTDTVLFIAIMLFFGFSTNVRLFSISTHIYLAMSFLDPRTGAFDLQPSLATNYFIIVSISSLAVLLCFLFPRPLTSTSQARRILLETGSAVSMILESLPLTSSELCRGKAQAAMNEMGILMKDLDFHLGHMWFEDFGILRKRARYRRWLQAFAEILKTSMQNFDAVFVAAAAVPTKESEQVVNLLPSLRHECCLVSSTLTALLAVKTPDEVKPVVDVLLEKRQALHQQLATEFVEGQKSDKLLLPPALVFSLTLAGVIKDTCDSLSSLALYGLEEDMERSGRSWLRSLQAHLELKVYERGITHPRFVLRYTISLTLTFLIGWLGISNVIAPYSSSPASTVSVIIYTFTGSSVPVTMRRLNGVVVGTVVGSIAQRIFAVQLAFRAVLFGVFQLVTVTVLLLVNFESKQHGSLALLTAAFAMSSSIPPNGIFRDYDVKLTLADGSFLFAKIVGTFIGVAVLLLVDLILSSSARRQSKQRLLRSLGRVSNFVKEVLDPDDIVTAEAEDIEKGLERQAASQAKIYEDLDELANLLPYAMDEPGALPFQADLFRDLEKGLRTITRHFRTILWAIQILEKPRRRMTLRAGSLIFKAKAKADAESKVEPLLRGELFRPILATLAEEIQLMLDNMKVIVAGIYNKNDEEAETVKEMLRSKLYTKPVSRAFCRIARSPWRTAWKVAALKEPAAEALVPEALVSEVPEKQAQSELRLRRSASNPDLALHMTSVTSVNGGSGDSLMSPSRAARGMQSLKKQKQALVTLAKKIRSERLEEEEASPKPILALPPVTALEKGGAKDGAADASALRLLLMFGKLREAASTRRSDLPENDAFSTLELIIFFLSSVQTQVQQMQLSLLEYG